MTGRDRLRTLLDAVLDEENQTVGEMARDAYVSPFHFSRALSSGAGESPAAMRRRVMLERAAWQLARGSRVTDAAWDAGYESVEGFSRAFTRAYGRAPSHAAPESATASGGWLPAPNGIHFHPPASLWVHTEERLKDPLTDLLLAHDLEDTRLLLDAARTVSPPEWHQARLPGNLILEWDGPEESLAAILAHHVRSKEVWLAAIEGEPMPVAAESAEASDLLARHDDLAPRWLGTIREIDGRGAWQDRIVDALCEPPESFVLSSVVAHVLTYAAHRRLLARQVLSRLGAVTGNGDPIAWLRT